MNETYSGNPRAEILGRITSLFDRFVRERMMGPYHFDDAALYQDAGGAPEKVDSNNQVFLNPFIKTEHDLAMKFGGFMEEEFLRGGLPFTVHAEIGLYQESSRERADMSVHHVDGRLWKGKSIIRDSTLAVIEIKGFGYRLPEVYCNVERMESDLVKFERLGAPKHAARIMIILDESVAGGRPLPSLNDRYAALIASAIENHVTLLSNNPALDSRRAIAAPLQSTQ